MGTNKAGKRTPERGQYGNTRGKERQRRRTVNRSKDPRFTRAMEAVHDHQEKLNRLIQEQKDNPAMGETEGAKYVAQIREQEEALKLAQKEEAAAAKAKVEREAKVKAEKAKTNRATCPKCGRKNTLLKKHGGFRAHLPRPGAGEWCYGPGDERNGLKGFSVDSLPKTGEGNFPFAGLTARIMMKAGYHVKHVVEVTGVGWEDISHIEIDKEGFGIRNSESLMEL